VVTPYRADSGTRLYGSEDVGRLTLIKRLVDRGDAISSVANLSLAQLRDRVSGADLPQPGTGPSRPCRVVVLGPALAHRLRREGPALEGLDLVGLFNGPQAFLASVRELAPDLVLFDYPTVHPDQAREVGSLLSYSGAPQGILIYGFATRATLERLDSRRVWTKRAPVDGAELRRWCLAVHQSARPATVPGEDIGNVSEVDIALPVPGRLFTDGELMRIATASTVVRCECPRHLVDLVSSLAAFEAYSDECEARNPDDAALHAFLNTSAGRARSIIESALAKVIAAEGVDLARDPVRETQEGPGE